MGGRIPNANLVVLNNHRVYFVGDQELLELMAWLDSNGIEVLSAGEAECSACGYTWLSLTAKDNNPVMLECPKCGVWAGRVVGK